MPTTIKEYVQATVNALLIMVSLWLIASPFVFMQPKGNFETTMDVAFGALIFMFAYFCALLAYRQAWVSCINIVLGILVLTSKSTMHYSPNAILDHNHAVTGVIVIVLAVCSTLLVVSTKKAA